MASSIANSTVENCHATRTYTLLINLDLSFFVPYSIAAVAGLTLNCLILLAGRRHGGITKRGTFRRLLIIVASLDALLCLLLMAQIGIYILFTIQLGIHNVPQNPQFRFEHFFWPASIFIAPRDTLIGVEMLASFCMAIDRAMAVMRPLSSWWNERTVTAFFLYQAVPIFIVGCSVPIAESLVPECWRKLTLGEGIRWLHIIVAGGLFLGSGVAYAVTFGKLMSHRRRISVRQTQRQHQEPQTLQQQINSERELIYIVKLPAMLVLITVLHCLVIVPFTVHYVEQGMTMSFAVHHTFLLGCFTDPIILFAFMGDLRVEVRRQVARICWSRCGGGMAVSGFQGRKEETTV